MVVVLRWSLNNECSVSEAKLTEVQVGQWVISVLLFDAYAHMWPLLCLDKLHNLAFLLPLFLKPLWLYVCPFLLARTEAEMLIFKPLFLNWGKEKQY